MLSSLSHLLTASHLQRAFKQRRDSSPNQMRIEWLLPEVWLCPLLQSSHNCERRYVTVLHRQNTASRSPALLAGYSQK